MLFEFVGTLLYRMDAAKMKNQGFRAFYRIRDSLSLLPAFFLFAALLLTPFSLTPPDSVFGGAPAKSLSLSHAKPVQVPLHSVADEAVDAAVKQGFSITSALDPILQAPSCYFTCNDDPLPFDEIFSHDYLNSENLSSKNHPPTYL